MSRFAWRGRDPQGDMAQGVIEADHADAVADQLLAIGVTPLAIETRA